MRYIVTFSQRNARAPFTKPTSMSVEAASEDEAIDQVFDTARHWAGVSIGIDSIEAVVLSSPFEDTGAVCDNCSGPSAYRAEGAAWLCVTCASLLK